MYALILLLLCSPCVAGRGPGFAVLRFVVLGGGLRQQWPSSAHVKWIQRFLVFFSVALLAAFLSAVATAVFTVVGSAVLVKSPATLDIADVISNVVVPVASDDVAAADISTGHSSIYIF